MYTWWLHYQSKNSARSLTPLIHMLWIPSLLGEPKRQKRKRKSQRGDRRWKMSCTTGSEMEKMLHHKWSFAISLQCRSWCRMEMGWFTERMALRVRRNVLHLLHCWWRWLHTVLLNNGVKEKRASVFTVMHTTEMEMGLEQSDVTTETSASGQWHSTTPSCSSGSDSLI